MVRLRLGSGGTIIANVAGQSPVVVVVGNIGEF